VRRKAGPALSEDEEAFWANAICVEPECQNAPLLVNAVKFFPAYHRKITSSDLSVLVGKLKEKFGQTWMNVLDNGEESLKKNVSSILERSMQTAHFEIVQLAANMNKLAGMFIPYTSIALIYTQQSNFSFLLTVRVKFR
jgi:hypothetical protein